MEFLDLGLENSSYGFVDKETNIELEISKLISEQERNNEHPNYDEVDQEIARLIHNFERRRKNKEGSKVSHHYLHVHHHYCPFYLKKKMKILAVINDRLGISQAMSRDDLEAHNLQKEIVKAQAAELDLEKRIVLNQAAQGPAKDAKKTESAPPPSVKVACIPHT